MASAQQQQQQQPLPLPQVAKYTDTQHRDLIHDATYNFYGTRMATCGSDHTVRIWDDVDGEWIVSSVIKAHHGSIWRVDWAHPEFGQVIATCSFDTTAAIWEEQDINGQSKSKEKWVRRAEFSESRSPVTCVQFAPRHLGFKVATCTEGGTVRVYEAIDVVNLSSWTPGGEFKARGKGRCNCLSWNPARSLANMMIAVGCSGAEGDSNIQIWEYEDSRRWSSVLENITTVSGVRDLSFAPNLGRSFHLLAAVCKDGTLRIWKITVHSDREGGSSKYSSEEVLRDDTGDAYCRISWNVTGTVLASSDETGCVKLWKANYMEGWKCISILRAGSKI